MKREIYILFNILFLLSCFFISLSINLLTNKKFNEINKKNEKLSNIITLNKEIDNYNEKIKKIKVEIDNKNKLLEENNSLNKKIDELNVEINKYIDLNKNIEIKIYQYK